MSKKDVYYPDYLQLEKLLSAQTPLSQEKGDLAHDEHLFIITHQVYELWFKQILFELDFVINTLSSQYVMEKEIAKITHHINRVVEIQKVLVQTMDVMETMTPMDFMDFRDELTPASGFQSLQFRLFETKMGLTQKYRREAEKSYFNSRLRSEERAILDIQEHAPNLFDSVQVWLERMPFAQNDRFSYWDEFKKVIQQILREDKETIKNNPTLGPLEIQRELLNLESTQKSFQTLFDEKKYQELLAVSPKRLSRKATLSALFIYLNREEPILRPAFDFIQKLIDMDEHLSRWRYRHAMMAHRLLGSKIGTGGSSGHEYLKSSAEHARIFRDFFDLASFLVPRSKLPKLPRDILQQLGFSINQ